MKGVGVRIRIRMRVGIWIGVGVGFWAVISMQVIQIERTKAIPKAISKETAF